ncbi:MAG: hypothetical protein KKD44_13565 [Proteobacteria bacterium]|nr:hypothetical protein [Pseudomonadota bacterium]
MLKTIQKMGLIFRNVFSGLRGDRLALSFQVKDLIGDMESLLAGTESRFLNLGLIFQAINKDTEQFTDQIVQAMTLLNARDEQAGFFHLRTYGIQCVDNLFENQQSISESLGVFEQVIVALTRLALACDDTDKIVLLLNVIALNIRIESNRSDASRDMFNVFIEEVKALARQMKEVTQSLYSDSAKIRKGHILSMGEIRKNLSRITDLANTAHKDMDESALHLKILMDKILESLDAAAACTRDMAGQTAEIVVALQFHDIVRQKIEHIIAAFVEVEHTLSRDRKTLWQSDYRNDLMNTCQVLAVQDAQLEGGISEIHEAHNGISSALNAIDLMVGLLYQESAPHVLGNQETGSPDDPFNRLMVCMRSLDGIRNESMTLGKHVGDQIRIASEATADLRKYVDEVGYISLDLHRKALNAIIKADHLGELGQGIEVFAQEVTTTSQDTNRFATCVVEVIQSVQAMSESLAGGGLSEKSVVEQDYSKGLDALARSYAIFQMNIDKVAGQFLNIRKKLKEARDELDFIHGFSRDMEGIRDKVLDLIHRASSIVDSTLHPELTQVNGSLYTMESERLAHDRVLKKALNGSGIHETLGLPNGPEQPDQVVIFQEEKPVDELGSTGNDDINDGDDDEPLGDNVELF